MPLIVMPGTGQACGQPERKLRAGHLVCEVQGILNGIAGTIPLP
jgi:hypothetical protein